MLRRTREYSYVPRCFPAKFRDVFPDASFVDDDTPGATSKDQLRHGASRLPAGSSGLLISQVGWLKSWERTERRFAPSAQEKARRGT
jgi:hypothetical protein